MTDVNVIDDLDTDVTDVEAPPPMARRGEIETRSAAAVAVRFPDRMIDVVAIPYDEPTMVGYHGRMIQETVARGAFEGVQMRTKGWKVNRAHDRERPIGYVHKFRPRDQRGLVAEIGPVTRSRDGDDALEMAADGLLGASVGFIVVPPNGDEWTIDRRSRTVRKAWLDHLALTGDPAYEGAKTLAVRTADTVDPAGPTPNLDTVLAWLLKERYSPAQP